MYYSLNCIDFKMWIRSKSLTVRKLPDPDCTSTV